jgi:hypothetical protein
VSSSSPSATLGWPNPPAQFWYFTNPYNGAVRHYSLLCTCNTERGMERATVQETQRAEGQRRRYWQFGQFVDAACSSSMARIGPACVPLRRDRNMVEGCRLPGLEHVFISERIVELDSSRFQIE